MSAQKVSLKQKLLHELKEMLVVFLYLALFFGAVTTYRLMLPQPPPSASFAYGFALIKALVLAKVILLGHMVRLTRVFDDGPLIVPTLYKVLVFGVFTFVFEATEHLVGGVIHGKHTEEVFREVVIGHGAEISARTLVVLSAFVPFFAFTEVSRVLGEGRLNKMFLRRRVSNDTATAHPES